MSVYGSIYPPGCTQAHVDGPDNPEPPTYTEWADAHSADADALEAEYLKLNGSELLLDVQLTREAGTVAAAWREKFERWFEERWEAGKVTR